jgi:hypothetical protein
MADQQELQVQQKREVDKAQEPTTPMRTFLPIADIFEDDDVLTVVLPNLRRFAPIALILHRPLRVPAPLWLAVSLLALLTTGER